MERAAEIDYLVEAVIEMALAGYLDSEAIAFVDCQTQARPASGINAPVKRNRLAHLTPKP